MKKTIFEQMGGTYTKVGDHYLPNLIPVEEETGIGLWGQRHLRYIKQYHKVRYTNLLTSGKLNGYLADIPPRYMGQSPCVGYCIRKLKDEKEPER